MLRFEIIIISFNKDYSKRNKLDLGLSRVKSRDVILVVRRPHLNWYSSCKQYLRRPSTKSLSNVCVCCKPFDARYIWLNTCNPHAFSFGVCSVHVTGAVVWNPGNRSDALLPWVYNLVKYARTLSQHLVVCEEKTLIEFRHCTSLSTNLSKYQPPTALKPKTNKMPNPRNKTYQMPLILLRIYRTLNKIQ